MKTKLFYVLMCLFAFTATNAQVITLIGTGVGGWDSDKVTLTTTDNINYAAKDIVFAPSLDNGKLTCEVKFRQDNAWAINWGSAAFPTGIGTQDGKNVVVIPGKYDVSFNITTGAYNFSGGAPIAVVKLFGTATTPPTGIVFSTVDGIVYTAPTNSILLAGNAQFSVDNSVAGGLTFPGGTAASSTDFIPVPAGKYTSITFNKDSAEYTFVAAPVFDEIGLIGSGTTGTEAGWSADIAKMTTTDGITYTLKSQRLYSVNSTDSSPGAVKFRTYGAWTQDWGGTDFPTGPTAGNNGNIIVKTAGYYDITFNKTTGAYAFSFPIVDIIGNGITGNEAGWGSGIDMATIDGENYTITRTLFATSSNSTPTPGAAAGVKFRLNNSWDKNWGGTAFPVGPTLGDNENIMVNAGTYAINFNRLTGVYDFGTALGVNKFDSKSFSAYPNPTRDSWNIVSGNDDITSIRVYDVLGKSVYARAAASKEVSVNASELSRGVYYAKVSTANGTSTVKLVKE